MLGVKSLDYNNYYAALKGNYRKGVHRFRTILANPQLAQEFAQNVGGVSVVLGWPIGHDDKNSQELLTMLLAHEVLTAATLTWLSQWYPEDTDSADALMDDAARCGEIKADALMWRAVTANPELVGKLAATLAGLDCSQYADIDAVAASSTAMAAIIASSTALNAVVSSSTAMAAVAGNTNAMKAVASSAVALNAVCKNATARTAFMNSAYRNTYYSQIANSLKNTTYFTAQVSNGYMVNSDGTYYYCAASTAGGTASKAADACIALVSAWQGYNNSGTANLKDLQTSTSRRTDKTATLTTVNEVMVGGFSSYYTYGGSGHSQYSLYTPK